MFIMHQAGICNETFYLKLSWNSFFIPPTNKVWVYSDPYVPPFVRPSVPPNL